MTEKQLQFKIVTWFSQTYPEYYGLLFEVNNDTYNAKHAMARRGMGMISGVSDLIFIMPGSGKVCGIELKAPGSRHDKNHIYNQLRWGDFLRKQGAQYIMSSDIDFVKKCITDIIEGRPIGEQKENDLNGKTVKF